MKWNLRRRCPEPVTPQMMAEAMKLRGFSFDTIKPGAITADRILACTWEGDGTLVVTFESGLRHESKPDLTTDMHGIGDYPGILDAPSI